MRNQGIAQLLESYDRLYFDPDEATDVYTRQCSLEVTAHDLAVMAATLSNGGVNPMTGERVIAPGVCRRVLAVMAIAGLYELSGDWLYQIGIPGKSGVSGGIVTVSPARAGWRRTHRRWTPPATACAASWSTKYLAERLGLNLFASEAARVQRRRFPGRAVPATRVPRPRRRRGARRTQVADSAGSRSTDHNPQNASALAASTRPTASEVLWS